MKPFIPAFLFCLAVLTPPSSAATPTATYTSSSQNVTLTGLGGSNGIGQSRVTWGACAYDGTNTNCTVSAPYTGVGGGGTISIVFSYKGQGSSPFTANSISPGSNQITFGLLPGNSGNITVSLMENIGAKVTFLSYNFIFVFNLATCTGISSSSCAVGQVGLTPNATITGTVSGTFDATPAIQNVISADAYGAFPALAPATWMEIYGTNLANVQTQNWAAADFNGSLAPTTLGGTTVTIGGQSAFIDYISPGQVNAQVPSNVSPGLQPVVVSMAGGTSAAFMIMVNATEPGVLAPAVFDVAAGQYVVALFPDGVTYVLPPGLTSAVPTARAKPGNTIVFYGVGFGPVTPNTPAGQIVPYTANSLQSTVQVTFAGVPGMVTYSGLAGGYLGLYQFDVVVPNVAASDSTPVSFSLGGNPVPQKMIIAIGN